MRLEKITNYTINLSQQTVTSRYTSMDRDLRAIIITKRKNSATVRFDTARFFPHLLTVAVVHPVYFWRRFIHTRALAYIIYLVHAHSDDRVNIWIPENPQCRDYRYARPPVVDRDCPSQGKTRQIRQAILGVLF